MLKIIKFKLFNQLVKSLFIIFLFLSLNSCGAFKFKKSEALEGPERAKKNIEEGRGVSIANAAKGIRGGKTTYEFSTSNPLWRASLETLDFLPLTTVDYSGGMIITDWYYDDVSGNQDSIKISIRFLANDIRSESLKVIVHKKTCVASNNCKISVLQQTKIRDELHATILQKAAVLEKEQKNKKQ